MSKSTFEPAQELMLTETRLDQLRRAFATTIEALYDLALLSTSAGARRRKKAASLLRAKILHAPHGLLVGQCLAELDERAGYPLQRQGVNLPLWLRERQDNAKPRPHSSSS